MQKRRVSSNVLPVTESDAKSLNKNGVGNGSSTQKRGRRKKAVTSDLCSLVKLLVIILAAGLVVVALQRKLTVHNRLDGLKHFHNVMKNSKAFAWGDHDHHAKTTNKSKPLEHFESIQYALDNSRLVGLYYGAAWCPMTTPITELLDQTFRDVLLPPPKEDSPALTQRHGLSLVYISSDTSVEEMKDYLRPNWMSVPFDHPDRNDLKRHFSTCAKRELEELGMKRKHEIPTLIIVSGESQDVLTYAGIEDVKEHGAQAMDHWIELEVLNSALGSKFADEVQEGRI